MNYVVVCIVLAPQNGYRQFLDGSGTCAADAVPDPSGQWDGRKVHIFRSASIIWGAVGPERFFAGRYRTLYWGFALGVLIPLVPWLLHKRLERVKRMVLRESVFSKTVVPIILHGAIAPPATPTNVRAWLMQIILGGLVCAYLSQKWARERHPEWFAKYKCVCVLTQLCALGGARCGCLDQCAARLCALHHALPLVGPAALLRGHGRGALPGFVD